MRTSGVVVSLAVWVLVAASIAATAAPAALAEEPTGPWALLSQVRSELSRTSPLEARFTQTFVPGGFSSGDTESGTLYVDLPRCLRFEYMEPFPKNFLLCGDWIYTWNPGEPSGRRYLTGDDNTEGLDLLRLDVDSLRLRYSAEIVSKTAGHSVIELTPLESAAEIRSATLELGPRSDSGTLPAQSLQALSYKDMSGDRTRFEITSYRNLEERTELQPPSLEWLQD